MSSNEQTLNIMLDLNMTSCKTRRNQQKKLLWMQRDACYCPGDSCYFYVWLKGHALCSCDITKAKLWKQTSLLSFLLRTQMRFYFLFSSTSLMGKGFSPLKAPVCCSDALSETTEIKFTWLAVFPGAKRIQAARSACYFAHDSSYLSPSLDLHCPARSGKLGKSAVAASSLRISWRTGTGLLYISHLSFSVWQESQYWRVCLLEYI